MPANQPSQGSGCLILAGLPFAAAGLFFAVVSLHSFDDPKFKNPLIGVIVGSVFFLIGALIIVGAIAASRKARRLAAIQSANPNQPWMWNADWARGRAPGQSGGSTPLLWVMTVIWNAVSWVSVWAATQQAPRKAPPFWVYLLLALFPAIGLVLVGAAIVQTMRLARYGRTAVQLQTLPAPLGRTFRGTIEAKLPYPLPHGINLTFSCLNRLTTQSGRDRTSTDYIRWQDRKSLGTEQVVAGPIGTAIPVTFDVPRNLPPTNHTNPNDQILWMLRAEADVPGVDFDETYEVPVFQTSESPSLQDWQAKQDIEERTHPATPPIRPTVEVSPAPEGGTRFYFPAARNKTTAAAITLFTLLFAGAEGVILVAHAGFILALIFGFFVALLGAISLKLWFGTATIIANREGVKLYTNLLGLSGSKQWLPQQIQSVYPKVTMQTTGAKGTAYYTVTIKDIHNREYSVGNALRDHNESEWICEQLRQLSNIKSRATSTNA